MSQAEAVMNPNSKNERQISFALKQPSESAQVVKCVFASRNPHMQAVDRRISNSGVFASPKKNNKR
ncbi:hypothetical protein [Xanthomonas cerealis]|uniref:hypothetical protein n=1 Tax=Xanthomonas cerealis TaxID=3390025 RepID=UPI001269D46E|nr:hypothetical protein [Xanthomonas translucens]UKE46849.1 hypothetical protein KHA79_17595 [Xanthomonas translucens pv. cerealis]